jgi:DNA-binding NarL/FixJ family response regulator
MARDRFPAPVTPVAIRVIIADDEALVRAGFAAILSHGDEFDVVGQYSNGIEAVKGVRALRPDVALLDVRMPMLDGLQATRRITEEGLPTRVIIVTTFDTDDHVITAIDNGASGYLLKDAGPDLLKEAIRSAATGDALVSPAITLRLIRNLGRALRSAAPKRHTAPAEDLTEREIEVVRLVAKGLSNSELAESLSISLGTVKSHLANVQSKLAARNRVEIASWAWAAGLMSKD